MKKGLAISQRLLTLSQRHYVVGLFIVTFAVRILFIIWNPIQERNDLYEHGDVAHHIVSGHGFTMHWPYPSFDSVRQAAVRQAPTHEGAFLPPVNPYILAGFYLVFGENETGITMYGLFLCILGAFVPLILYRLAKYFTSEAIARLTGVFAAINVFAAFGVSTFTGSIIFHLLAALSLLSIMRGLETRTVGAYITIGVLLAAMILIRSEYFLLGPVLIIVAAFMAEGRPGVRLRFAFVPLLVGCALIAPWVYRNYQLFDRFVPVLSHPWYEVWRGNNSVANGTRTNFDGSPIWVDSVNHRQVVRAMDALPYDAHFEVAADSIFKEEVFRFWRTEPMRAAGLGIKKLGMFTTSDFNQSVTINVVYASASFVLFMLTVVGMIAMYRDRSRKFARIGAVIFGLFLIYYLGLTFFTIMLPRYQIYVLNTLLPAAAIGFGQLEHRLGRRSDG